MVKDTEDPPTVDTVIDRIRIFLMTRRKHIYMEVEECMVTCHPMDSMETVKVPCLCAIDETTWVEVQIGESK